MKTIYLLSFAIMIFLISCKKQSSSSNTPNQTSVKNNYANMAYQNYKDALDAAKELKIKVNVFINTPTEMTQKAAKDAWLQARESYGLSEAFRFAGGPIDEFGQAPEGLLNAWPLDENYIDYVSGSQNTEGIIGDSNKIISKDLLESLNEQGGESNISIGYHAIEFLLWGQDNTAPEENKKGLRPYTDYIDGEGQGNEIRRGQYLKVASDLLVDHLKWVVTQWESDGAYRLQFMNEKGDESIKRIIQSISIFIKGELSGERIDVAYTNKDQEDEHSCFSDNTHRDIILNAEGVQNIFLGKYRFIKGMSIYDLVKSNNESVANDIKKLLETAISSTKSIHIPFDEAISNDAYRPKVLSASNDLKKVGDKLVEGAKALGYTITSALPE